MSLVIYNDDIYNDILTDIYKTFYFLSNLRKIKIDYMYINPEDQIFKLGILSRCSLAPFSQGSNEKSDLLKDILESDNLGLLLSDVVLDEIIVLLIYIYELIKDDDIKEIFKEENEQKSLIKIILLNNDNIINNLLSILELLNFIFILKTTGCPSIFNEGWAYFNDEENKERFKNNPYFFIDIFDENEFDLMKMHSNLMLLYEFLKNCMKEEEEEKENIDNVISKLFSKDGGKKILKTKKKLIKKLKKYIK